MKSCNVQMLCRLLLYLPLSATFALNINNDTSTSIVKYTFTEGDATYFTEINIGGLLSIHNRTLNGDCSSDIRRDGMISLEAMFFSLNLINRNLMQQNAGFRLGAIILDDCMSERVGLDKSLEFVQHHWLKNQQPYINGNGSNVFDIVGVIGPMSSNVAEQVANLFTLFKIPLISFLASNHALSNEQKFPYFLRTLPSDRLHTRALLHLMAHYNWSYIVVFFESSNLGQGANSQFLRDIKRTTICVAHSQMIRPDSPDASNLTWYRNKLTEISIAKPKAKVIVLFANELYSYLLLKAADLANLTQHFTFIGSDTLGGRYYPEDVRRAAVGSYLVIPEFVFWREFNDFIININDSLLESRSGIEAIWSVEFLRLVRTNPLQLWELSFAHFIYQAVDAFAQSLLSIRRSLCPVINLKTPKVCARMIAEMKDPDSRLLIKTLRNIPFRDIYGNTRHFEKSGERRPSDYSVMYYAKTLRSDNNSYGWHRIATIDFRHDQHAPAFNDNIPLINVPFLEMRVPISACSELCNSGSVRRLSQLDKCCWTCVQCKFPEYQVNSTHCQSCIEEEYSNRRHPPFYISNVAKTDCVQVYATIVGVKDTLILFIVVISCLGIVAVTLTFIIVIVYRNTPIVKAAGREVSIVLLLGILILYITVFLVLLPPTMWTCGLTRFIYGTAYTVCYAAIFVKMNRLVRIFKLSSAFFGYDGHTSNQNTFNKQESQDTVVDQIPVPKKTKNDHQSLKKVRMINPLSQIAIIATIVSFQCMLNGVWLFLKKPEEDYAPLIDYDRETYVVYQFCEAFEEGDMAVAFVLPFTLLLLTMTYSYMARKIPGRFNETKYIILTTSTTCILWLSFIPIFVMTNDNQIPLRVFALCAAPCFNATVTLLCMFAPIVHMVLFRPHKNTRDTVLGRKANNVPSKENICSQRLQDEYGSQLIENEIESNTLLNPNKHLQPNVAEQNSIHLELTDLISSESPHSINRIMESNSTQTEIKEQGHIMPD